MSHVRSRKATTSFTARRVASVAAVCLVVLLVVGSGGASVGLKSLQTAPGLPLGIAGAARPNRPAPSVPAPVGALAPAKPAPAVIAAAAAKGSGLRVLHQNVLDGIARAASAGAPSPSMHMNVAIGLARPHVAEELSLLHRLYDPASADYLNFPTEQEFAARFGVDEATFARAAGWLTAGGLEIVNVSGNRDYVVGAGTAAQVEKLFRTTLRLFSVGGHTYYANVSAPSVPADLPIISVIGLNDVQRFRTFATHAGPTTGAVSPQDLWSIYDLPDQNAGQGQSMGIIGEGQTDGVIADLRAFEEEHHLRKIPITVKRVIKNGDYSDNAGAIEWNIDTQSSTGMAPLAYGETLYFGTNLTDADVGAALSAWATDPGGPKQASASLGQCEEEAANPLWYNPLLYPINIQANPDAKYGIALGNNFQPVAEEVLRGAVMVGKTLFASTGDTGSSCPAVILGPLLGAGNGVLNQGVPFLNYPAASPYAVGVGGTVLYTDGNTPSHRFLEYAWPFTGGGTSFFITAPDVQNGITELAGRCLIDPTGSPSNLGALCRGLPDVSAISGDIIGNGYTIYSTPLGGDGNGGGTSLSSPLWMGMWARIQAASPSLKGNGWANAHLYRIGKDAAKLATDFTDVTLGANGLYAATPGWDYVSGFGTPNVSSLMKDIDGKLAPTLNILPPLPPVITGPVPPCGTQWIDDAGDASYAFDLTGNGVSQLDLVAGSLALAPDKKTLKATLTIADLTTDVPTGGGANDYYMSWAYKGTTYFAGAEVSLTGVSYSDGTLANNLYSSANTDTGTMKTGKLGTIEIDVPLANVGNPPAGTVLPKPIGNTYVLVGSPQAGGSLQGVDSGGPGTDATLVFPLICPKTIVKKVHQVVQTVKHSTQQGSGSGGSNGSTSTPPVPAHKVPVPTGPEQGSNQPSGDQAAGPKASAPLGTHGHRAGWFVLDALLVALVLGGLMRVGRWQGRRSA
jgi:hypothetical protein